MVGVRFLNSVDADPLDRQKRIAGWKQERVSSARCLVVGAGALGNETVKNLLQLGVRALTIVDFDTIVPANLNRCIFFTPKDAEEGLLKAETMAKRAKEWFPESTVTPIAKRVEELSEEFFGKFDFCFGCLDSLGARLHLNAQLYHRGVPLIDGGTTGYLGRVQVSRKPSPCLECGMNRNDYTRLWKRYSCTGEGLDITDPKMPALPTTTSITAALQAKEFVKIAHGQPSLVGKAAHYNGFSSTLIKVFELSVRKDCPVHSD